MENLQPAPVTIERPEWREVVTDAIRYWEPRRLLYNAILTTVVVICFSFNYPGSRTALTLDHAQGIFLLAVLANIAYCAAYLPDIFAQISGFRGQWRKSRWVLFAIGVTFACILARFTALNMFRPHGE
jgi:hypothetical protein